MLLDDDHLASWAILEACRHDCSLQAVLVHSAAVVALGSHGNSLQA